MTQKERFRQRWWIPIGVAVGLFLGWHADHVPKPPPLKLETTFQIDPNDV